MLSINMRQDMQDLPFPPGMDMGIERTPTPLIQFSVASMLKYKQQFMLFMMILVPH